MVRTPLASVARQLRAANFVNVLDQAAKEILDLLKVPVPDRPVQRMERDTATAGGERDTAGEDGSTSSATISGSVPASPTLSSRKRKRAEPSATPDHSPVVLERDPHWRNSITGSLIQAVRMVTEGADALGGEQADEKEMYVQEHMKSVIRSEPVTAARILGTLLTIISTAFTSDQWQYYAGLDACVQIWESRSQPNDDLGGEESHVRQSLLLWLE